MQDTDTGTQSMTKHIAINKALDRLTQFTIKLAEFSCRISDGVQPETPKERLDKQNPSLAHILMQTADCINEKLDLCDNILSDIEGKLY